jgi:hypothetical protein
MKLSHSILPLLLFSLGCAHSIHEVHVSDFNPPAKVQNGDIVKASTEQFVVLGFVTETDYVDQAKAQLLAACPRGQITGITTQYSTSLGFFSWTNKILMQGLCLEN